jgi:hypothetical protein
MTARCHQRNQRVGFGDTDVPIVVVKSQISGGSGYSQPYCK